MGHCMSKTPNELADEHSNKYLDPINKIAALSSFLAGYQAAAPQWISMKDRLPEIPENDYSNRVLLLRADGFIVIARIEKCVRFVRPLQQALIVETDNGDPIEEFTHWMPLPNPPEE